MSLRSTDLRRALAALALFGLVSSVHAGDDEFTAKGQVKIGSHNYKMEAGRVYLITVEGKGFQPAVNIRPGFLPFFTPQFKPNFFQTPFVPKDSQLYTVVISPGFFGFGKVPEGALDYALSIKPIPLSEKPILKVQDKWTDDDPLYKPARDSHFKVFPIKMKAGQFYLIDLVKNSDKVDPFLYLEDPGKKVVASDDDSGGNLNARIVHQAKQDGEYRIIATTLFRATGDFTVTVRGPAETKSDK